MKELERLADALGVSLEYFGVGGNDVKDLIARARVIFENDEIPHTEKAAVYKEVMRLYLKMEE